MDRTEDTTTVIVYSNQPAVTLYRNGKRHVELPQQQRVPQRDFYSFLDEYAV